MKIGVLIFIILLSVGKCSEVNKEDCKKENWEVQIPGHSYVKVMTSRYKYQNTRKLCRAWGGTLLQIKDKAMQDFLMTLRFDRMDYYIGLSNHTGIPTWEDGTTLTESGFTNWKLQEKIYPMSHCVVLDFTDDEKDSGKWKWIECDIMMASICQVKVPCDPHLSLTLNRGKTAFVTPYSFVETEELRVTCQITGYQDSDSQVLLLCPNTKTEGKQKIELTLRLSLYYHNKACECKCVYINGGFIGDSISFTYKVAISLINLLNELPEFEVSAGFHIRISVEVMSSPDPKTISLFRKGVPAERGTYSTEYKSTEFPRGIVTLEMRPSVISKKAVPYALRMGNGIGKGASYNFLLTVLKVPFQVEPGTEEHKLLVGDAKNNLEVVVPIWGVPNLATAVLTTPTGNIMDLRELAYEEGKYPTGNIVFYVRGSEISGTYNLTVKDGDGDVLDYMFLYYPEMRIRPAKDSLQLVTEYATVGVIIVLMTSLLLFALVKSYHEKRRIVSMVSTLVRMVSSHTVPRNSSMTRRQHPVIQRSIKRSETSL